MESKRKQKIVVNALLNAGEIQKMTLTKSNPLGQFYYDQVEDAEIILWDGDEVAGKYTKAGYGKWELVYKPIQTHNYKLEVKLSNGTVLSACTTMPQMPDISKSGNQNTRNRKHFLQEPSITPYYIFIMDQTRTAIVPNPVVEATDKLQMHIGTNHPSVDGFNMQENSMQSLWGSEFTTMEFRTYLRIVDDSKENQPFYVEGRLWKSLVFFRAASDEYDRYLKSSLQKMLVYEVFNDDTQKFDENEVYSNITNGIGIFAAYNDRVFVFNEVEN